jgi:hypothetical protein
MQTTGRNDSIVVSALHARANFLLSIRDYIKLAVPEPEVLRVLGEESKRKGTNTISSRRIDTVIRAARADRRKISPSK